MKVKPIVAVAVSAGPISIYTEMRIYNYYLYTFQKVVCFFLVAFVLAFIRPLTVVTAASTSSILFTEIIVYMLRMLSTRVALHRIELIANSDDYIF